MPIRVVIEVTGEFDGAAAHAVCAAFMRGVEGITIDFTRALRIDPVSLAILAGELARHRKGAVAIHGLPRHEERLLRYLGARVAASSGPEASASA
jgi:hypothetical protein